MASIWTYPVSFPFGATTAPYTPSNPHKGDDRAAPQGTPVTVNNVQIGLVGTTGFSTGPHLHVARYVSGVATNPKGQGSKVTGAIVSEIGYTSGKGNFVRVADADGSAWEYLHLSRIDVLKGQRLEGQVATDKLTKEEIILEYSQAYDVPEDKVNMEVVAAFTGKPLGQLLNFIKNDPSYKQHFQEVNNPPGFEQINEPVYRKK